MNRRETLILTETNVGHLLLAADLLSAEGLEQKCLKFLGEKLTIANCMKRFQLVTSPSGQSQKIKWKRLHETILLYIQMEFNRLVLS